MYLCAEKHVTHVQEMMCSIKYLFVYLYFASMGTSFGVIIVVAQPLKKLEKEKRRREKQEKKRYIIKR